MAGKLLFIAEKPNMGKEIARAMTNQGKSQKGFIEVPQGYVTWCVGHLLRGANPEEYKAEWKKWDWATMPIIPETWEVIPEDSKKQQVDIIKKLLKQVDGVVNAGDPGREGQVIIDELLDFLKNKKPVHRLLLYALDPATVRTALKTMQPNTNFTALYQAGLGRSRADWLVGMNMTRSYTLIGRCLGKQGVLSVGRVQTPTLYIVVFREREIANFVSRSFHILRVPINHPAGVFAATWVAREPQEVAGWATNSNIWDSLQAKRIQALIANKSATVVDFTTKEGKRKPPVPFKLGSLQTYADKKWGYAVTETLGICQELYEKGCLSYPRTDCTFLPESHHAFAPEVLAAIGVGTGWQAAVAGADLTIKSPVWNDKKVGEHYGLVPTKLAPTGLDEKSQNIYNLCAWRYLVQFYPPALVDHNQVEFDCEGEKLVSRGQHIKFQGWLALQELLKKSDEPQSEEDEEETAKDNKDGDDATDSGSLLPTCAVGEAYQTGDVAATSGQTKPPGYFTEGTLLDAMEKAYQFVKDPAMRQKLKDIEGIGRSATRAAIIDRLLKVGLLFKEKGKKFLRPSPSGMELVDLVPERLRDPATTALWELALDGVAKGKLSYDDFYAKQIESITKMVADASAHAKTLPAPVWQPKSGGKK